MRSTIRRAAPGRAPASADSAGVHLRVSLVRLRVSADCSVAFELLTIAAVRHRSTLMASPRIERHRHPPTLPRFYRAHRWSVRPHVFLHELLEEHGDFVCWRGFIDLYLVNHPEFIRRVLSQDYDHFSKRTFSNRLLALGMGAGLITNDGPHWASQRRLLQPLFANRNVNRFDEAINALTGELMREWDARAGKEAVWVDRDMSRLASPDRGGDPLRFRLRAIRRRRGGDHGRDQRGAAGASRTPVALRRLASRGRATCDGGVRTGVSTPSPMRSSRLAAGKAQVPTMSSVAFSARVTARTSGSFETRSSL